MIKKSLLILLLLVQYSNAMLMSEAEAEAEKLLGHNCRKEAYSPDGQKFVLKNIEGVVIFDEHNNKVEIPGFCMFCNGIAWNPNSEEVAIGFRCDNIQEISSGVLFYNLKSRKTSKVYLHQLGPISSIEWSKDGSQLNIVKERINNELEERFVISVDKQNQKGAATLSRPSIVDVFRKKALHNELKERVSQQE